MGDIQERLLSFSYYSRRFAILKASVSSSNSSCDELLSNNQAVCFLKILHNVDIYDNFKHLFDFMWKMLPI